MAYVSRCIHTRHVVAPFVQTSVVIVSCRFKGEVTAPPIDLRFFSVSRLLPNKREKSWLRCICDKVRRCGQTASLLSTFLDPPLPIRITNNNNKYYNSLFRWSAHNKTNSDNLRRFTRKEKKCYTQLLTQLLKCSHVTYIAKLQLRTK